MIWDSLILGYFLSGGSIAFNELSKKIGKERNRETLIQTLETVIDDHLHFEDTGIIYAIRDLKDSLISYRFIYRPPMGDPKHTQLSLTDPLITLFTPQLDLVRLRDISFSVQATLKNFKFNSQTLLMPLRSIEGLEGILILGERSGGLPIREAEIDFLRTIQQFVNAIIHMTMPYEKLEEIVKTQIELQGVIKTVVTLSHEINSPLASLSMGIGALQRKKSEVLGEALMLENMKKAVTAISDVIQRLRRIKNIQDADYLSGVKMIELPKNERVQS